MPPLQSLTKTWGGKTETTEGRHPAYVLNLLRSSAVFQHPTTSRSAGWLPSMDDHSGTVIIFCLSLAGNKDVNCQRWYHSISMPQTMQVFRSILRRVITAQPLQAKKQTSSCRCLGCCSEKQSHQDTPASAS